VNAELERLRAEQGADGYRARWKSGFPVRERLNLHRLILIPSWPATLNRDPGEVLMELDKEKIDRAVLALLCLGLHDGDRAWKSFDWGAMSRLHEKGYITDPVGKAKSVAFTEEGLTEACKLLEELFGLQHN
jgi:hypothetical protein